VRAAEHLAGAFAAAERAIPAFEREINAASASGVAAEVKVAAALARLREGEGAEA
jgi:hypothetical protein